MTQNDSYKRDALRTFRQVQRRKRAIRIVSWVLVFSIVLGAGSLYVSKLPRERHARHYSFVEKVFHGVRRSVYATYLRLSAEQPDPGKTPLPIVELYMKGKRLDKLTRDLPESGSDYQKADMKLGSKTYKVQARFRGDSINHWAFPARSWRIKMRKGKSYEDMRYLNFNVPRSKTQMSNWLGYELARNFDHLLVPDTEYVHFRFNRNYDGVRMMLEQPNQDFLRRRNLTPGKIYVGDIDSQHIYGGVARKHIYKDSSAWSVRGSMEEADNREVVTLLDIIREEHDPYAFYDRIQGILDVDATLEYIALLDLVGSVHVDETHNGKFYFNPVTGRFQPIVWDTVAYFWKNKHELDMASNSLFRVLLSNPGFREQKDKELWNAIQGDLSESVILDMINANKKRIQSDILAFALKIHANDKGIENVSNEDWLAAVDELKTIVSARHDKIRKHLSRNDSVYRVQQTKEGGQFAVQVRSPSGIQLGRVVLQTSGVEPGTEVSITRRGIDDIPGALKVQARERKTVVASDGTVSIALNDHLFSKRRYDRDAHRKVPAIVPATYVYSIKGAAITGVSEIQAMNAITRTPFTVVEDPNLKIFKNHRKNIVWWDPTLYRSMDRTLLSGDVRLSEDLIIDRGLLEVAPGTNLTLDPGVSILVRNGRVKITGTETAPIQITASDPSRPWGTIALLRSQGAMEHISLTGGTHDTIDHVRYNGALSFYDSTVQLRNSSITDAYISARRGSLKIRNVKYSSIFEDLLQVENAQVQARHVKKIGHEAVVTPAILEETAHGTPRRTEREFKWSITGLNTELVDLELVAEEINAALKASLATDVWNAPKYTGTSYFCDAEVKDFLFRDIYFDTQDRLAYTHDISYRLRNRYDDQGSYDDHLKQPYWTEVWPYRLEYQAKVDRKELGNGFSTVEEARFEFRAASEPFSQENLPPAPPWDLREFLPYFKDGHYKGMATYPAQEVVGLLHKIYPERESYHFEPEVVVLTRRVRQHFNIKSDWGSGPNPEQSFIISLDQSDVYDGTAYMNFFEHRMLGDKKLDKPIELGTIVEIELEFERNVSDVLDRKIEEARSSGDTATLKHLSEAREAFLKDQHLIMEVIKDHFAELGITVAPATKSKYKQSIELR